MIKKALVMAALLVLFFLISLAGCNQKDVATKSQADIEQSDTNQQDTTGYYQPSITVTNETVPEIATILVDEYLQHYKSNDISEPQRLSDYKINEIIIKDKTNDGFICSAKISVKGVIENTSWGAGSGILNEQGWIENKIMLVTVNQNNNIYTLTGWGTGL